MLFRSGGIIAGGSTDANQIAEALRVTQEDTKRREAEKTAFVAKGPGEDLAQFNATVGEMDAAIDKNKRAMNEGTAALQQLADSGELAANALALVESQQKAMQGGVDIATKIFTSDPEELRNMTYQLQAAARVSSGQASEKEMRSLTFRQQAAAGSDILQQYGLIDQETARMQKASFLEQSAKATGVDRKSTRLNSSHRT